jgi:putative transposase
VLGQHRSTQRKVPCGREDEEALTVDIVALATRYGRRLAADHHLATVCRLAGERRAGGTDLATGVAESPGAAAEAGRLWLTDGSYIRLRPEQANHVWSYDFVEDRAHDGRKFRMLNVINEFTRECLAIRVG